MIMPTKLKTRRQESMVGMTNAVEVCRFSRGVGVDWKVGGSFVSGLESGGKLCKWTGKWECGQAFKIKSHKNPKKSFGLKKTHTFASSFNVNFQLFLKFCQKIVGRWETSTRFCIFLGHYFDFFVQTHIWHTCLYTLYTNLILNSPVEWSGWVKPKTIKLEPICCCFSAKYIASRRKNKDRSARNQDNGF